jgi:phosphoribosyl 1,2-cyclic phosphodiesterase
LSDRLRFCSLGSGSRGNASLVECDGTLLMVDCGFSVAETESRLARLGRTPDQLSGILVTHEHGDHVAGLARVARTWQVPVWLSAGTRRGLKDQGLPVATEIAPDQAFSIDALEVLPVTVVHDSREPTQFVFSNGAHRLGILTDLGEVTPHVERHFSGLDAILLESNHDLDMLEAGPYPNRLKKRVRGRYGHLNNGQAADLLAAVDRSRLQHVIAAHVSEKNNTPSLARDALAGPLGCASEWVGVAWQDEGLEWREVA